MKSLKGKALVLTAAASVLGVTALGSMAAFADESTEVKVKFSADATPPDFVPGTLQLVAAPRTADFGTMHAGFATAQTKLGNVTGSGYIKVLDDRTTGGTEWSVSAKASKLTSGSHTIDDATISIDSTAPAKDWTAGATPAEPGILGGTTAVVTNQTIDLTTDDATTEIIASTANSTHGNGYAIPYSDINLTVPNAPASFAGEEFEGTITWSLNDTV